MVTITLTGLEFYAYHGYYEEEQRIGGHYLVDVQFSAPAAKAIQEDDLNGTINYATVYTLVAEEMKIPSRMLEHLAGRIVSTIERSFPGTRQLSVTIHKLNPPLSGKLEKVSVTINAD